MAAPAAASNADAAQAAQAGLVSVMASDITTAWSALDVSNLAKSLPSLQLAVAAIVRRYGLAAATLAVQFYNTRRQAAGITAPFTPRPAPPPPVEQVAKTVDWATQPLWADTPDLGAAQSNLAAASERLVLDVGRQTIVGNVARDRHAKAWARVTEPGACAFCLMLATRGASYRSEATADFLTHNNCVPAGTLVTGPSVQIAYRRWYEGELVIIGVPGGQELAITPNHPVLTSAGWVPAGLLTESHQIVQRSGVDLESLNVPHEDDVPTRIEDVWGSPGMGSLVSMPVAAEHFHGDGFGTQGHVQVVRTDRFLSEICDASLIEQCAQPIGPLARGAAVAGSLTTQSNALLVLDCQRSASDRSVSGGCQLHTFCGSELPHAHRICEAARTDRLIGFREPTPDNTPSHPVLLGDLFLRLARTVKLDYTGWALDPVRRRPLGPGSRFDPPATEDESERLRIHADYGSALLERLAGGVKLSRPLYLRRVNYSGHVFNLQTAEGWYGASDIIVSNCRCHAEPVFTAYEPPARIRAAQALYRQSTAGLRGKAAVKAFRQAVEQHPDLSS